MKRNNGKNPWRFVCLAGEAVSGLWLILPRIVLWLMGEGAVFSSGEASSIGIIGGADGPTAIFVTRTGPDWDTVAAAAMLILSILLYLRLRKESPKQ